MADDKFHSELLAVLKNAHDDIERTKQRQWRDFYNVLVAIGAVTGLYLAVYSELNIQFMHYLFFAAPIALMILGIWLVHASQQTLEQLRKLVENEYYKKLDQDIQNILDGPFGKSVNRNLYPELYKALIAVTALFGTLVMIGLRSSQSS